MHKTSILILILIPIPRGYMYPESFLVTLPYHTIPYHMKFHHETQVDFLPSAMLCRILHLLEKHIFSLARFLDLGPSGPVT